jgi:hypothetical protein
VATGDSGDEAYTAIAWGVGLSHERSDVAGAESFHSLEGNMCGTAMRGADALPGSKATSRAKGSHRKLGDLGSDHRRRVDGPHRWEAGEQSGAIRGGAGGAKGGDQGKCEPAKHVPDAEPGERVTSAGAHTASSCRHTPEVGAVCGKAARTVLCGGRAMKRTSLPLHSSPAFGRPWRMKNGSYYGEVRLLVPVHHRLRLLTFPPPVWQSSHGFLFSL